MAAAGSQPSASAVDGTASALPAAGCGPILYGTAGPAGAVEAAVAGGAVADGGDGAEQGIWLESCTPFPPELWDALGADGMPVLAGFGQGGLLERLAPGPGLALLLPGSGELSGLGDDELTGVMRAWRRLGSWAAAMEHAAVAELSRRRINEARSAGACLSEAERFAAAEVAAALTLTRCASEGLVGRALSLADLPAAGAALSTGLIDMPKALVILNGVAGLDDEAAGEVEARVAPRAPAQTTGELRNAVAQAAMAVDPAAAGKRHDEAVRSARVERWTETAGTGALAGRDLPVADVLAADNRVNALAAALKSDGAAGEMDLLRAQVFIGLLLGRPVAAAASGDAAPVLRDAFPASVADGGAGATAGPPQVVAGPTLVPSGVMSEDGRGRLSGSVNLTVPLATLAGLAQEPGEVAGFGPVTATAAAQIAAAGWGSPGVRWCVTVTGADGAAVGHGCAGRRVRETFGTPETSFGTPETSRTNAATATTGTAEPAVIHGRGGEWEFTVRVSALARERCDHRRESARYAPPASLRHLIEVRDITCCFPGCRRPARQCDLDHTVAYGHGGRSCECNLAPLCRFHHKLKQTHGWALTQPAPGVLQWTAPSGWKYTVTPRGHPT